MLAIKCDLSSITHVAASSVSLNSAKPLQAGLSPSALSAAQAASSSAGGSACSTLQAADELVTNGSSTGLRRRALAAGGGGISSNGTCAGGYTVVNETLPLLTFNMLIDPTALDVIALGLPAGTNVLAAISSAILHSAASSYELSSSVWSTINCATFDSPPMALAGVTTTGALGAPASASSSGLSDSQKLGLGIGIGAGLLAALALVSYTRCRRGGGGGSEHVASSIKIYAVAAGGAAAAAPAGGVPAA